jgi:hypothetical protein
MRSDRNFYVPLTREVKSLRSTVKPATLKWNEQQPIHRCRERIALW